MANDYAKDVLVTADWVEERLDDFKTTAPTFDWSRSTSTRKHTKTHTHPARSDSTGRRNSRIRPSETFSTRRTSRTSSGATASARTTRSCSTVTTPTGSPRTPTGSSKYYGHDEVYLLDGGREYWLENDYPTTDEEPDFSGTEYDAAGPRESIRAYREDVENAIERGVPLVDVRSPEEYSGEILAPPGLQETAQRGGHIPGAKNISWAAVTNDDGTFKDPEALEELYADEGHRRRRDDRRLLPHRRAVLRRLVRPARTARLRGYRQLRRVLDRVGQPRQRAD